MDPQTTMEAAKEGAKALSKFEGILNKMFTPRWTKKQADADEYSDKKKIQLIRDNPDMSIQYVDGKMNLREKSIEELALRAEQRTLAEAVRQEMNLEKIFAMTSEELQQNESVSDEPVDDDWLTRFFDIAKNINSEEMQLIWSKILAGEIESPGSFTLRTLDTIRNIGKAEAEVFQKIIPLVVKGGNLLFVTSNSELHNKYGVSFSDVLLLDECGLINSSSMISLNPTINSGDKIGYYTDKKLIEIKNNDVSSQKISIGVYVLKKAGMELFSVLKHNSDDSYIFDFSSQILKENKRTKISVEVFDVISIHNGNIKYIDKPIRTLGGENQHDQL